MKDVTSKVGYGSVDDESLPINRCVCGTEFGSWSQIIGIYEDNPWECPNCHIRLVFRNRIRIFSVDED
jgi:DNA-directed RNA polymerase subunit RPC12/RpoP